MGYDMRVKQRSVAGFTMLEVLVVVGIVLTLAAISFPAISQYIRNYKIRAAASAVAGQLQTARSKAIMTNTNAGVSFVAVDADSFRWIQEDLAAADQLGPLYDLPVGIRFVASGTANAGPALRFGRLGNFCTPGVAPCAAAPATTCSAGEDPKQCNREKNGLFIGTEPGGGTVITLLEENTGLQRTVRIASGGRVMPQQ
jgi:prepilin-type N-terminal cleavage/methylation domain-containing protein